MNKFFKRYKILVIFFGLSLLLAACRPNVVNSTLDCDMKKKVCTSTVTNMEGKNVDINFQFRKEAQGTRILPFYRYPDTTSQQFDHWSRNSQSFMTVDDTLLPHETKTYTVTLPNDFINNKGQSLLTAYVHVFPPNPFSVSDAEYFVYTPIIVSGESLNPPVEYVLGCQGTRAIVTIKNNGEWGDKEFALYLDEELTVPWQKFKVAAGDAVTFTSDPFPSGSRLLEVDVFNHQEASTKDVPGQDYHGTRAYCVPGSPNQYLEHNSAPAEPFLFR